MNKFGIWLDKYSLTDRKIFSNKENTMNYIIGSMILFNLVGISSENKLFYGIWIIMTFLLFIWFSIIKREKEAKKNE